ncbi:hypothetical protein J3Q64DRAFT_1835634 [Phycomyces blakesleeanus]|uniref:Uncharacterized protein n=2 Tax=Phycomyces blakesleeanus TaxID=4837 RepID=A0A167P3N4_PHYB8|nr:hypothetical protein PHYBLDRAFT_68010 [Phycomyces blakesleeanus NRRL 1555(-)]OAD77181.1 hypothetical protein PHYBLDRAFT_68010 [Phycomyces blakesleeanus NRRL 1555(-)]|eukprot:XP_018295221.1 hypothetical protein PHYBLDRAFT_68010 [Phycomyces blakesleeanus NRRL 1555(-)]
MQRTLRHLAPRALSRQSQILVPSFNYARGFNTSGACNDKSSNENQYKNFPWKLSTDPLRIPDYPYKSAPDTWSFLNILPRGIQHSMSQFLCNRMLELNTGSSYFPEQFLVGASMASRRALDVLSNHLSHPNDPVPAELQSMLSPELLYRLTEAAKETLQEGDVVSLSVPQVYDVNVGDIWVTLGNSNATTNPRKYELIEWMTLQLGLKRSVVDDVDENFKDYRARVSKGLMEGAHVAVDVLIDADVEFSITRGEKVLVKDQGRRELIMRFETPYFEPAHDMVSGRDEMGEPINEWRWRIADVDHWLEKEKLDRENEDEDED